MGKITIEEIKKMVGNNHKVIDYDETNKQVVLFCSKHGEFKLRLDHLKEKIGKELCKECKKEEIRIEKFKKFVEDARKIHGDKYIYHEETFINMSTDTIITCPIHGDFPQLPNNHIHLKQGCRKCYEESRKGNYKYTREEIIEMAKQVHGDKYVYDDVVFQGMKNKLLNIYCPKHGYFSQIAYDHLRGFGCEECKFENQTMTKEEFVQRATEVHNGFYKYDLDKIVYVNNHVKVPIICPIHGVFKQRPAYHLIGGGCDECNNSKLENEIRDFLSENEILFEREKQFSWLGRLSLDFYLSQYNIAIECQGLQHFEKIEHFNSNGSNGLEIRKERDERKRKLCEENGVKLLYYSNLGIEYPYEVFEDKEKLLQEIRSTT